MSNLLTLLRGSPSCKITFISSKPRKVYREGDTRIVGKSVYQKTARMAYGPNGRIEGYACRRGKQLYDWVRISKVA